MDVIFPEVGFSSKEKDEIDEVLYRISVGNESGEWRSRPDDIRILKRLSGGRSGSEVLEVVVKRGNHDARKVIKLGPGYDLENEFKAFDTNLRDASSLFVRIEAATPVALGKTRPRRGELEAVVYDHVARFRGMPQNPTQTFEEIAREGIRLGGSSLEKTVKVLGTLFDGIHNDLYDKHYVNGQETTLQKPWNRTLGIDAVVAIDRVDPSNKTLETSYQPLYGTKQETLRPRSIASASVRVDGGAAKGDIVQVSGAKMNWQGDRLVADDDAHYLRIEVHPEKIPVDQLVSRIDEGSKWMLRGQLVSLRMEIHRERLLNGLSSSFKLADGMLIGPGAHVRDPFTALPYIIEGSRPHRITSVVHGDLNPRNIVVIDESPCLIDYALTRDDEPIFMDFTRLEGCLTRDVLPDDFSWAQHVRLQRLLAAACRLGDEAAQRFEERLAADRAELASAFRLLWTIRKSASTIYPKDYLSQWVKDYLEQLYLFAHLTLKWGDEEEVVPWKLRATAAMAGVAAEALSHMHIYDLWSTEALREDGGAIIQVLQSGREEFLSELANLAQVWHRLDMKQDAALQEAFEHARARYVRRQFRDAANGVINQLHNDHEVYINLKAYINLKGQLRVGYRRQRRAFEEMLETDELLAIGERLREHKGTDEDVLRLITKSPVAVLIGDAGSGKSTVAREWEYRLASSIVDQEKGIPGFERNDSTNGQSPASYSGSSRSYEGQDITLPAVRPRLPLVLRALDLPERLRKWDARKLGSTVDVLDYDEPGVDERRGRVDLLTIGALYIIVDALNELTEEQKQRVADWIIALRDAFPNTPILVCHRQYNYVPGLLPFPIVTLQKVEAEQARRYVYDYLREKDVSNPEQLAQRLVRLLLDDPDHAQVRDLAQTPLFLWMIVERYRQTGEVPESRGGLFETFSRWYLEQRYHEAHQELTRTIYSYEDKALLLGALGYELVQRRATNLHEKDAERLVPRSIKYHWQAILEEIIAAEMLYRDEKNLRFMHQSFQEYFAARHFLFTQAKNQAAIRRKVSQLGWHDTFAVLLGFAGDTTGVVTQVIEEALKVNPLLTARCLRMAEQPDPRLLERFVALQEAILRNVHAGEFAHERAAQALAEHGRGPARAALWRVVDAADAPDTARVAALNRLATMPSQVRFEPVAENILRELVNHLPHIFDKPAPATVQQAAVKAIVTAHLKDLGAYLFDLVVAGEWHLRWVAWQACDKLGLKLTRVQQASFIVACRERLDKAEEELFQETVKARMDELNAERLDILRQLATPDNLPLLLKRRLSYSIGNEVGAIIDQVVQMDGELPMEAREALRVLTEQPDDDAISIDRWLELLLGPDDLVAIAAAHRLLRFSKELPGEKLRPFFNPGLPPERLSAVAYLAKSCQDEGLVKPLEALIRSLMETINDAIEFEALANLVTALKTLDGRLGNRMAAVANTNFYTSREESLLCQCFPWAHVSIYLVDGDYQALLTASNNDARAAVFNLSSMGGFILHQCDTNNYVRELDSTSMRQLLNLARSEKDMQWQNLFACAFVEVNAVGILPWLIDVAHIAEMEKVQVTTYNPTYGVFEEPYVSDIHRAIGYLARVLLDKKRADKANLAVTFLHERYAELQPNEERSIVEGLTTGLGYLGDWEPILTHLGPGEPWMHKAARNVFEYWVPTPLNDASAKKQQQDAAIWIARRLRDHTDLAPQVRSTLERIKDGLETKLGRHVQADDE